jgi:transposase/lambda repressor-like predicted transcriptional regulator
VHKLIRQWGLTIPPPAESAVYGSTDPVIADIVRLYQDERLSLATIGQRYHHDPDWVSARLRRAGVSLRPAGRQRQVDHDQVRGLLDAGLRVRQIADQLRCSETTVLAAMKEHGWSGPARRPRGPNRITPPRPAPTVLRRLYVTEDLSISAIAERLGVSHGVVRAALSADGITVTRPGWTASQPPPPISEKQLRALYVDQQMSTRQVADVLNCTPTRVLAALKRHGITVDPRRQAIPTLPADAPAMFDLYVTQRLDDATIARQYDVPTWRVTQRRRELGVHRPRAPMPRRPTPPAPSPAELQRLYVDDGRTLEQIARANHTSKPVVRKWLEDAQIPVQPRTSREHRKQLDPVLVAELYQEREWSAAEIAAHLDVGVQLVLRTLHDHGVPVRPGGPPPSAPSNTTIDPRLTALYADPEITAMLRRHRIPRREQPGSITERFPDAAPVTESFLRKAYLEIGLAATHIEQLTGQPAERILALLHASAVPVRSAGSFSPWYLRQRSGSQMARPASRRRPSRLAIRG